MIKFSSFCKQPPHFFGSNLDSLRILESSKYNLHHSPTIIGDIDDDIDDDAIYIYRLSSRAHKTNQKIWVVEIYVLK